MPLKEISDNQFEELSAKIDEMTNRVLLANNKLRAHNTDLSIAFLSFLNSLTSTEIWTNLSDLHSNDPKHFLNLEALVMGVENICDRIIGAKPDHTIHSLNELIDVLFVWFNPKDHPEFFAVSKHVELFFDAKMPFKCQAVPFNKTIKHNKRLRNKNPLNGPVNTIEVSELTAAQIEEILDQG